MPLLGHIKQFLDCVIIITVLDTLNVKMHYVRMRGHVVLSLKQLAGNSSKAPENVLCPAVIVSPKYHVQESLFKLARPNAGIIDNWRKLYIH